MAYALAGRGVSLVINGRDDEAVAATVEEIIGGGGQSVGVCGPAGQAGVVEKMADAALSGFGALEIAINYAGIAEPPVSTVLTITEDQFRQQIDAHLMSSFHLNSIAGRVFAEQHLGRSF